ncbi:MAG: LemA family protein [Calditrichia bacterium]
MITIAIIVVLLIIPVLIYNSLISKRNNVDNAFASIDAFLKKRYDLIPNLVNTVKTYMQHEKETLTKITELRAKALNATPDEQAEIDKQMTGLMKGIMVAVENYPELKANENFIQLQQSLNNIEEQIAAARRAYNAAVTEFNTSIQVFPNSIIAGITGFKPRTLFEIPPEERGNVDVGKLFNQ